jgi:hypothetical protein
MAEVKYREKLGALISTITWSGLRNGDRGEPIRNVSGNISFQINGDFGVRGQVVIEASIDGRVYKTANDRRGNPALVTEAAFVRPRVYVGDHTTSITVTAVFRRPKT